MPTEDKTLHQKIFMGTNPSGRGIVEAIAELYQLSGNSHPYFSITTGNGCDHDMILASMPHLKPLVDLHLSDEHGAPSHAVANAAYHMQNRDDKALSNHLRISVDDAREVVNDFTWHLREVSLKGSTEKARQLQVHDTLYAEPKERKAGDSYVEYEAWAIQAGRNIAKAVHPKKPSVSLTVGELASIAKLNKFGSFNRKAGDLKFMLGRSAGWAELNPALKKLKPIIAILRKSIKAPSESEVAHEYMKDLIDSCFLSYWQRQADKGIEMLQGEDEHLEATIEEGTPVLKVDGEKIVPEQVHKDYEYLPYIECGDRNYYVALTSEEAGEKAREYWEDMVKNDASEFEGIVGAENLVKWGMGQAAGPGSSKVYSLSEWLDLHLTIPQEQWATYNGEEVKAYANRELYLQLGYTENEYNDSNDEVTGLAPLVVYRA